MVNAVLVYRQEAVLNSSTLLMITCHVTKLFCCVKKNTTHQYIYISLETLVSISNVTKQHQVPTSLALKTFPR